MQYGFVHQALQPTENLPHRLPQSAKQNRQTPDQRNELNGTGNKGGNQLFAK
ncbi:MAG: hypothetical protein IPI54_14630 [Chitinophagaceae bacterium]|nr:hypothetical protein [Chitinophagaceae bacterium]